MKTQTCLIIILLLSTIISYAQPPQAIPYQAVARDQYGDVGINQNISLRFSIHDATITGTVVYSETQTATTNNLGLFTLNIGQGTVVTGNFSSINWDNGSKFIQTEMDISGGTNYVNLGTQQMLSVPYALNAKNGNRPGISVGDMQYWDGAIWHIVPAGLPGQFLQLGPSFIPRWEGPVFPTISTDAVTNITGTTAISHLTIISEGGALIENKGICFNTIGNPTTSDFAKNYSPYTPGLGQFSIPLTGLAPNTTYYLKSFAINSTGTTYGNEVTFSTISISILTIGMSYEGGIIAYILQPSDPGYDPLIQHGLIAAQSDQGGLLVWWNGSYVNSGATATALGTGNANTNTIISIQGAGNYAAKFCYDLVLNGYSDWYLPSKDELNLIYLNIGMGALSPNTNIGGFAPGSYWSSSEVGSSQAWYQLGSGPQAIDYKYYNWWVRPVRSF